MIVEKGKHAELLLVHDSPKTSEKIIRLEEGASIRVEEIFLCNTVSKVKIIHDAPNTKSRVYSRGIVRSGESLAYASIVIPEHAKEADTFVSQKFLTLSKDAQVKAIPSMEIEPNDVKAAHASTVCPLEEDKLFYLASRGLDNNEAKNLLIKGFLHLPKNIENLLEKCLT